MIVDGVVVVDGELFDGGDEEVEIVGDVDGDVDKVWGKD